MDQDILWKVNMKHYLVLFTCAAASFAQDLSDLPLLLRPLR